MLVYRVLGSPFSPAKTRPKLIHPHASSVSNRKCLGPFLFFASHSAQQSARRKWDSQTVLSCDTRNNTSASPHYRGSKGNAPPGSVSPCRFALSFIKDHKLVSTFAICRGSAMRITAMWDIAPMIPGKCDCKSPTWSVAAFRARLWTGTDPTLAQRTRAQFCDERGGAAEFRICRVRGCRISGQLRKARMRSHHAAHLPTSAMLPSILSALPHI